MNSHFDYESDDLIGAVKCGLRSVPLMRSALFQLADTLAKNVTQKGFLLLIDSSISTNRINEEWTQIRRIINPDITNRLGIYLKNGNTVHGWPEDPDREMRELLQSAVTRPSSEIGMELPKTDYFSVILKILLINWLGPTNQKPEAMTMKRLGELAGCSYPTVSAATDRLEGYLKQSYSEGIQLRRFPHEEWHSMILRADKIRATLRLVDRSGQPRRPIFYLDRLANMHLDHIGVGGVSGALALYPDLNITGSPRLDVCVHAPGRIADIEFVKKLDPALESTDNPMEPAQVVLHFVRSAHSYFEQYLPGIKSASWVECMLDLHEMRLSAQADEWLNQWIRETTSHNE